MPKLRDRSAISKARQLRKVEEERRDGELDSGNKKWKRRETRALLNAIEKVGTSDLDELRSRAALVRHTEQLVGYLKQTKWRRQQERTEPPSPLDAWLRLFKNAYTTDEYFDRVDTTAVSAPLLLAAAEEDQRVADSADKHSLSGVYRYLAHLANGAVPPEPSREDGRRLLVLLHHLAAMLQSTDLSQHKRWLWCSPAVAKLTAQSARRNKTPSQSTSAGTAPAAPPSSTTRPVVQPTPQPATPAAQPTAHTAPQSATSAAQPTAKTALQSATSAAQPTTSAAQPATSAAQPATAATDLSLVPRALCSLMSRLVSADTNRLLMPPSLLISPLATQLNTAPGAANQRLLTDQRRLRRLVLEPDQQQDGTNGHVPVTAAEEAAAGPPPPPPPYDRTEPVRHSFGCQTQPAVASTGGGLSTASRGIVRTYSRKKRQ